MTNQLASLAQRDYFYLDPFWSVNLGTYIINDFIPSSNKYRLSSKHDNETLFKLMIFASDGFYCMIHLSVIKQRLFVVFVFVVVFFFITIFLFLLPFYYFDNCL